MVKLQRILCAVDFSEFSRRALDHALGIARCYGASVTALHVIAPTPVAVPLPAYLGSEIVPTITIPRTDRRAVAAQLQQLITAEQVRGVAVDVVIEEAPDVNDEILAQATRLGSDLLVMGTHGRSGFDRLFLGSTAEKVLRKSRIPVMTVPPGAPDAMPRGPVAFTRILCPVDFSPSSTMAVDYAVSLAREGQATLTLLHVLETVPLYYDFTPSAVLDAGAWTRAAGARLRRLVPDAARASCSIKELVVEGRPSRQILTLAAESDTDLIVMGVQGRHAAELLLFGSTTHHVVREAHCAVLTLRG